MFWHGYFITVSKNNGLSLVVQSGVDNIASVLQDIKVKGFEATCNNLMAYAPGGAMGLSKYL